MTYHILQIILFQSIFLIIYDMLLKKNTFFNWNRAYLLLTSAFSIIIPFIKINSISKEIPHEYITTLPTVLINFDTLSTVETIKQSSFYTISIINWGIILYLIGFIISLFILFKKIALLRKTNLNATSIKQQQHTITILKDSKNAFSFWNTIFIGDQLSLKEKESILTHEIVHIKHKHSIDLIWFEILKLFFWFNPIIHIYKTRITSLHEFIADAISIHHVNKKEYVEQLLNTTFQTKEISFSNHFFIHSLLKKRIIMLQKSKSKKAVKFRYLIAIPLLVLMLIVSSFTIQKLEPSIKVASTIIETSPTVIINTPEITGSLLAKEQLRNIPIKNNPSLTKTKKTIDIKTEQQNLSVAKDSILKNVRFSEIDLPPRTLACKDASNQQLIKKCFSNEISKFVSRNFNIEGIKEHAKPGLNRIYVRFKIDTIGQITDIESRAAVKELEIEANRVIKSIPKVIPGEHNNKKVNVLYSLPIVFKISDDKNDK